MKFIIFFSLIINYAHAQISLNQVNDFGPNPGELKMYTYVPQTEIKSLVVLLHGCAQAASDFDDEIGWTKVADKYGMVLLLPQQTETNNNWRCFNWFQASDITRGEGEIASISHMIDFMKSKYQIEDAFATGLSAGGAMANILLATYPEYFKAGAIVAGLPVGCATNQTNAWYCMYGFQFPIPSTQQRGDAVREAAGPYSGKWPSVMIVHGTSDEFVSYKNARYIFKQWTNVHGSSEKVKLVSIKGMKHGYPIDPEAGCGSLGKFIIDANYCAAESIAKFFLAQ